MSGRLVANDRKEKIVGVIGWIDLQLNEKCQIQGLTSTESLQKFDPVGWLYLQGEESKIQFIYKSDAELLVQKKRGETTCKIMQLLQNVLRTTLVQDY